MGTTNQEGAVVRPRLVLLSRGSKRRFRLILDTGQVLGLEEKLCPVLLGMVAVANLPSVDLKKGSVRRY